jgi:paraquat-inducible protein B
MSDESQPGEPPRPLLRSRRTISPIWAIPIVAVLVALWLAYKANSDTGQTIQITFLTGEGLDAGKTRIKHNNVELGIVDKVEPTADLKTVVVTATMKKLADRYLDGAQFWVVRPRISFSSLSGLETLLSDKYIEMDPGDGKAGGVGEPSVWCRYSGLCAPIKAFTGLEEPPAVRAGVPGTEIFLDAEQLGSIVPAAPVYFHGEVVGEVLNTNFNTGKIELKAQINAPYDRVVLHKGSRFWNASGITINAGVSGFSIEMESVPALLAGGIAFDTAPGDDLSPAQRDERYPLYPNQRAAIEAVYVQHVSFVIEFDGSVHGLEVGAPVEFRGIHIGNVTHIHLQYDPVQARVRIPVTVTFEPQRVERAGLAPSEQSKPENVMRAMAELVSRGLRAQLHSQSLISSALFVSFDIFPNAPPAQLRLVDDPDGKGKLYELPTVSSSEIENLESSVAGVVERVAVLLDRVNKMPIEQVFQDASATLQAIRALANMPQLREVVGSLDKTLNTADDSLHQIAAMIASADAGYGGNSDVRRQLVELLRQLQDTAKSMKTLADTLEEHPESLIRGKGTLP